MLLDKKLMSILVCGGGTLYVVLHERGFWVRENPDVMATLVYPTQGRRNMFKNAAQFLPGKIMKTKSDDEDSF